MKPVHSHNLPHLPELRGGAQTLTSLAADLIVAVAACVEPSRVASLIPSNLDRILLEPPDKALHQTKLDKPPGHRKGRDCDHNAEMSNTPAPPTH